MLSSEEETEGNKSVRVLAVVIGGVKASGRNKSAHIVVASGKKTSEGNNSTQPVVVDIVGTSQTTIRVQRHGRRIVKAVATPGVSQSCSCGCGYNYL